MKSRFAFLATALSLAHAATAAEVIFSEVMYNPSGTKAEWIEVTNVTTNRLDMGMWKLSGGADLTLPDFDAGSPVAGFLLERERILLSSKTAAETRADYPSIPGFVRIFGPWTGALDNSGELISLLDKNGARLTTLDYNDGGRKWPVAPDGTGHSLVVINENRAIDDWHNWKSSTSQGGTPGTATVIPAEDPITDPTAQLPLTYTEAVPMTATWAYYQDLVAPPANWNSLGFTPAPPWGSGPALLGFETAALPAPGLQTGFGAPGLLTYYFRTNFNWTGGTAGVQFEMDTILDDGATFYINGVYVGNKDGVAAVVHNSSIATTTVTDAARVNNAVTGSIPAGVLVDGTNVLAAVGLQVNTGSSDMIFGSNLRLANAPAAELFINEVKQAGAGSGFIEFYNPTGAAINLNGYHLTDTSGNWTKYPITQSVSVPAGGLATLGFTESGFSATATTTTIYLARPNGVPITGLVAILPQDGRSIGRKPVGSSSWFRFSNPTPGLPNTSGATGGGSSGFPVFNEVGFGGSGNADFVEFTNVSTSTVTLDGLFVASAKDFSDKVALSGPVPVGGFASFNVSFIPDNSGYLVLYLIDGTNSVLGEAEVTRRVGKASSQVWPAGSGEWYASTVATRDSVNVPDRNTAIVMTEIMYAPPSAHRQGEFIELYNRSGFAVNVGGWIFTEGISYVLPAGTSIAPGARLVVAQDAAFITANHPAATNVVGNYGGTLSNSGELIRLVDADGNLADEVDYKTGGDWPRAADSLGGSLELRHPAMDNDAGSAWAASNDSQKGQWTPFTYTGVWANSGPGGFSTTEQRELHFNLVGDSHVILRNITFGVAGGGQSPLTTALSPTNTGADGWRVTGTHYASFSDAEGLHIVADGGGDLKGNAVELDVPALNTGSVAYTISFEARWVSGIHRLVMNTWDRSWGRTFAVPIPNNLGTAGAANSVATASAGPEIWSMLHSPAVPRVTDDVRITARVSSSSPLVSVNVRHRLDNVAGTGAFSSTAMNDGGTGGDDVAGDGIYTATITEYKIESLVGNPPPPTIVQFYIEANATGGGTTNYPATGPTTPGHWIVDSTPVTSDLLVQRFIVAQRDHDSMGANGDDVSHNYRHPRMSNHYYNATLIINEKEVLYNVETRKSGSPFTRLDDNTMDRIRTKFPKDRLFRGREKTGADNDAAFDNARRMNNRMSRYWLYLLGYPAAEAEFVQVQFNTRGLSLKDDTEPTDTDMLDRTYGNSGDTELHEIDDSWYFGDNNENRTNVNGDWVVTAANLNSAIYWMGSWPIRTQSDRYDYSPLTSWIRTMYNNGIDPADGSAADATYRASVERQFDVDKFARYAAVKGWAGAWDNFTINRGKNGYVYRRPTDGRWEFEFWDGDLDFQNTGESVLGGMPGTVPLFGSPWFRRQMNYYLQEIRDKWSFNSPRVYAWLQAMEDQSPSYGVDQNYFKSWFSGRRPTIDGFIGSGNQTAAFTATASVPANTPLNFTDINGSAPSTVFSVSVDGHPEGVFTLLTQSTWSLSGIYLRLGSNALTVRAYDRLGAQIGLVNINITKTGNAPPVLAIVSKPESMNVAIGEVVTVEPTGSFDPEGTALALSWTITPAAGVINNPFNGNGRRLIFSTPGIYTVTLNATDGAGIPASLTRELTVFSSADFASFGTGVTLSNGLTAANTEIRDNHSPNSWYSLEDSSGRLLLQINETAAALLDSTNFPSITRPLPASANWIMQTDAKLDTRQLGESFNAGLILNMVESGVAVRYVYSIESGNQVLMRRADATSFFYSPPPTGTPTPIFINAGGGMVAETDGRVWAADSGFLATPPTNTLTQDFLPAVPGLFQHYGIIGDTRRTGVSGGALIYEVPVDAWPNNYDVTLYSSIVTGGTLLMSVSANDGATSPWLANSSASQLREIKLSNVARNVNGKIKIAISRSSGVPEAGINGIWIVPRSGPPPSGGLPAITPAPMTADALRVERSGNTLIFSRKVSGVWVVDSTRAIPAGSTAANGGVFASTETPMNLRASFDYLLIADPSKTAPVLAALRLTEVMYNPASGGVEYLEFQNTGPDAINLLGVAFPAGQPFSQYNFASESLASGEFIVLTANPAGFREKYGVSPRLAVSSWASGGLDNGGERVVLMDPNGNAIHDFTYDDVPLWPVTPDGTGPSLEVIDPFGNYNDPLNWRASTSADGTPGGSTRLTDPDADGDGVPDWAEQAFGVPANSPGQGPTATATRSGTQITITWPFLPTRHYRVERSDDMLDWQPLGTVVGQGSYVDTISPAQIMFFYRVTALPYP